MFFWEKIKQNENVCTCLFFVQETESSKSNGSSTSQLFPFVIHVLYKVTHLPAALSSLIVQQDSCFGHVLPSPLNRLRMFQTLPIISRGHDKMLQPGAPSVFMVSRRSPLGLMGPQRGGGGPPSWGTPCP